MRKFSDEETRQIIEECKEFLEDSSAYYSSFKERKKHDLSMYSDDFWSDDLKKSWNRGKRKNEIINQWGVLASAISSPFSQSPWHIQLKNTKDELATSIQDAINAIEHDSDCKHAYQAAFRNCTLLGEGAIVWTTVPDAVTGKTKIVVENIRDIGSVAFDSNSTRTSCSDGCAACIVNFISVKKAKRLYGDDIVPMDFPRVKPALYSFGKQWDSKPDKSLPIVTYYRIGDDGFVEYFKLCSDRIVDYQKLTCTVIPVLRYTGWEVYRDGKYDYTGIVDKTYSVQLGLNLGYSTLLERMGRSIKASAWIPCGALDGLEQYYTKMSESDGLVLLYNSAAGEPKQIHESYETSDLAATIATTQQLMSAIVGVPTEGIQGINFSTKTATEVLQQQLNAESNVAELYSAAFEVQMACGRILIELLNGGTMMDFELENGPSVITQQMKRRQELTVLSTMCPENLKPILLKYYADTLSTDASDKLSADIVANLDPSLKLVSDKNLDPYAAHEIAQLNAVTEDAMATIEAKNAEIEDLKKQVEGLSLELYNKREERELNWQKFATHEANQVALDSQKLQLDAAKAHEQSVVDAAELRNEAQRVQLDAQKQMAEAIKDTDREIGGSTWQ